MAHARLWQKYFNVFFYAGMLLQQKQMNNPTLLVVTDRNDLDGQLFTTFSNAESLLKQRPVQANDRDELRRLLAEKNLVVLSSRLFKNSHPLTAKNNIQFLMIDIILLSFQMKPTAANMG